jgi:hypothetical protein
MRKEASAKISSLAQYSAGLEEKPTERLKAAKLLRAAEKFTERLRVEEKKRVVCYESYEWVRGPLAVLECITMVVDCIVMMVGPQTVKDENNLEFLQLLNPRR